MEQQRDDRDLRNSVAEGRREAHVVQPSRLRRREERQDEEDNVAAPGLAPEPG